MTRNFAYTATGLLCDQETGAAASCSGGNVTSDDAGRLSDQGAWHYLYDANARLVSACKDPDCVGSGFDRVAGRQNRRIRIPEAMAPARPAYGIAVSERDSADK